MSARRLLLAATLAAGFAGPGWAGSAAAPPAGIEPGSRFPDLALPSLDGSTVRSIREFAGRKVVLHVFASW
jgi:hypothetical protein